MAFVQMLIQTLFSLVGAGSILFMAMRAYTIGNDIAEMKEMLRDIRRSAQNAQDLGLPLVPPGATAPVVDPAAAIAAGRHKPGDWPSVMDPEYNAPGYTPEVPYDLRPTEPRR